MVVAYYQNAHVMIAWNLVCVMASLPVIPLLWIIGKFPKYLGRLTALYEARGKVRIVAITDWWTQVILKPLHHGIFNILKSIPQDGTFDQLAPVHALIAYVRASGAPVYSYDLSAATDRLPIAFQVDVLKLLGVSWASSWQSLLVSRPWYLKGKAVYYSVGQPMGALSSWAMLALSHHIVVQIAASRVNWDGWFPHYALLGDDIIIADEAVAGAYRTIMHTLGVPINLSKSFEILSGTCEFAKRWIDPTLGEITPMSPGLILAALRNPRILATLLRDSLGRGFIFSTRVWRDVIRYLAMFRNPNWARTQLGPILSSAFGPTGGLWTSASGPYFKAAWIEMFPLHVPDKLNHLVGILFQGVAESQSPPPSEEDLRNQLVSNFWKRAVLFGTGFWGCVSAPLLIISPAFWVYYDQAARARTTIEDYLAKLNDLRRALVWSNHWLYKPGTGLDYKANALRSVMESTFDPGLLEWDRLQAEKMVKSHQELFDRVDATIAAKQYLADFIKANSSPSEVDRPVALRFGSTPPHLALVQLGYWGFRPAVKFAARNLDIPSPGGLSRCLT